jgi:hypothetical protein
MLPCAEMDGAEMRARTDVLQSGIELAQHSAWKKFI